MSWCCCNRNTFEINDNFTLKRYLEDKLKKEDLLLLLSGSVYIQISYYPLKYWKKYVHYILDDVSSRRRTLSIHTENDIWDNDIITLPTSREKNNNKKIKNIPENDILNISGEIDIEIFTPFSSVAKNHIDNLIYNNNIKNNPKILKIQREEYKYSCYLIIIKEMESNNIFLIPKIEIYSSLFKLNDYKEDIINSYIENGVILDYIIENRLEGYNINIMGHLSTCIISYNFLKYLRLKYYVSQLIIFEPYLEDVQNILIDIDKLNNKDKIKYLIFSTNINITNSPKLLDRIIYIPQMEMKHYNNNKICGGNLFDVTLQYNKKKNIRSYVHTLFKNIDEEIYLPQLEI